MEMIHTLRERVLASSNANIFVGDTPADLTHFIDTLTVTHVWKPFIYSSVREAKDESIQGIQTLQAYFTPTALHTHRPKILTKHTAQHI
jgi:hypothetical protein